MELLIFRQLFYGTWNADQGLSVSKENIWKRRSDLSHVHFSTVIEQSPKTTDLIFDSTGTNIIEVTGAYMDVFAAMNDVMNFTYSTTYPPDRTWGSLETDGTWSGMYSKVSPIKLLLFHVQGKCIAGMVRMLQKKEIDFSFAQYSITLDRAKVCNVLIY